MLFLLSLLLWWWLWWCEEGGALACIDSAYVCARGCFCRLCHRGLHCAKPVTKACGVTLAGRRLKLGQLQRKKTVFIAGLCSCPRHNSTCEQTAKSASRSCKSFGQMRASMRRSLPRGRARRCLPFTMGRLMPTETCTLVRTLAAEAGSRGCDSLVLCKAPLWLHGRPRTEQDSQGHHQPLPDSERKARKVCAWMGLPRPPDRAQSRPVAQVGRAAGAGPSVPAEKSPVKGWV